MRIESILNEDDADLCCRRYRIASSRFAVSPSTIVARHMIPCLPPLLHTPKKHMMSAAELERSLPDTQANRIDCRYELDWRHPGVSYRLRQLWRGRAFVVMIMRSNDCALTHLSVIFLVYLSSIIRQWALACCSSTSVL
jgi:hypothetical protein